MKKTNTGILFASVFILMVFAVSFISADETTVIVNGLKGYIWNITLTVINPSSGEFILPSLENATDITTGSITFKYTSATQTVSYSVFARSNGKIVASKSTDDLGNFSTGVTTTINLIEQPASTPVTTTPNTTVIIANTSSINNSDVNPVAINSSGNATRINLGSLFNISGTWGKVKSWSKIWLPRAGYLIVAIIVICGVGYGIFWYLKKRRKDGSSFKKYEDLGSSKNKEKVAFRSGGGSNGRKIEEQLEAAERKIREAQEDIERIKNRKSHLSEAQKNFEKAKRELEEAKGEFE